MFYIQYVQSPNLPLHLVAFIDLRPTFMCRSAKNPSRIIWWLNMGTSTNLWRTSVTNSYSFRYICNRITIRMKGNSRWNIHFSFNWRNGSGICLGRYIFRWMFPWLLHELLWHSHSSSSASAMLNCTCFGDGTWCTTFIGILYALDRSYEPKNLRPWH